MYHVSEKYGSLDRYGDNFKKIFIIYHEELNFDKNYGQYLIGNPDEPSALMSDNEFLHS